MFHDDCILPDVLEAGINMLAQKKKKKKWKSVLKGKVLCFIANEIAGWV